MAKTKIKRCLYIGLGGTGMLALLYTKKKFIETYGKVPPMIGFLGIDTDAGSYKKYLNAISGEQVSLSEDEKLPIMVDDPMSYYEVNKNKGSLSWLPQENLRALTSINAGAGQVRTNGRFAFTINIDKIKNKLNQVIAQLTNASIRDNNEYETMEDQPEVEFHMAFSICGGTGCGTFLNMACLIKEFAPRCKLTGYAVLPNVFKLMSNSGMAQVGTNAYGALMDLDYLMSLKGDPNENPVRIQYLKYAYEIKSYPFNAVFFIDNKNRQGDTYKSVDDLAEMISLAFITSAGALSDATTSVSDNLEKRIGAGTYNIENKVAWGSGLGACEVIYRGTTLAKIYSLKAIQILIDKLNYSKEDANQIANMWIDSPDVNIRENNNQDHVIDYICSNKPRMQFSIQSDEDIDSAVALNINTNTIKDDKLNKIKEDKLNSVCSQLKSLVIRCLNKNGGVTLTQKVLNAICEQVSVFLKEMTEERASFADNKERLNSSCKLAKDELANVRKSFNPFVKKKRLQEAEENLEIAVRNLVVNYLEITRRSAAIVIFNGIMNFLSEEKNKVNTILQKLDLVYKNIERELAYIINSSIANKSQLFQIDLAQNSIKDVTVNRDEIQVVEFLKTLNTQDKILNFANMNESDVANDFIKYTNSLPSVINLKKKGINDELNEMKNEDFKELLELIKNKSSILDIFDKRGYDSQDAPQDSYYIGVPEKGTSRLEKDDNFKKLFRDDTDVNYTSIGMKDRIIAYRIAGVYPAYTVASVMNFERDYKRNLDNANLPTSHFDNDLYLRMKREEWSLSPAAPKDDEILRMWVLGFMFGLIKNDIDGYKFKCEELGDALTGNWFKLKTSYRDDAFNQFKSYQNTIIKEYTKYFEEKNKVEGSEKMQSEVLRAKQNYYNEKDGSGLAGVNISAEKLSLKEYSTIADLVRKEINLLKEI